VLPCSRKKGLRKLKLDKLEEKETPPRECCAAPVCCVATHGEQGKAYSTGGGGGHLRNLLIYDVCAIGVSFLAFVLACLVTGTADAWRVQTNLFFARIVWGLLSLPFFLLTLPVFGKLLTHAEPTGFNESGDCVPISRAPREKKPWAWPTSPFVAKKEQQGGSNV